MRQLVLILGLASLACITFGMWGMLTHSGQRAYPELSGMLPYYVGVAGTALLVVTIVLAAVRFVRWHRRGRLTD